MLKKIPGIYFRIFGFTVLDFLIVYLSFFISYRVREISYSTTIQSIDFYANFILFASAALPFSFYMHRLYSSDNVQFSLTYLIDFLKAFAFWGFSLIAFAYFTKTDYSRTLIIIYFIFTFFLSILARFFLLWISPPRASFIGDPEIIKKIKDIIKFSEISPDSSSSLEEYFTDRKPGLLYFFSKRIFDIFLSAFGLIILLPFLPFTVFYIRKDSPGPAIIKQERVGKNGKKFILYKFRTMRRDTLLYALAPREGGDSRITRVGRIFRKYSIDELPQLLNVLRGEMSIVGPRPEMPFIVARYKPWQKLRLDAKPGVTGLWQILGRKDLPLEENIEYDFYYIYHQSFFLDLAIILKTIPTLLLSRGAY